MAAKSFLASQRTDHAHVERTALLGRIDAELVRSGVVVVCAPWGYGKSDVLGDYNRIAHARMPLRPLLHIDFAMHEVQAYLRGNAHPMQRLLAREARSALWLGDTCAPSIGHGGKASEGLPGDCGSLIEQTSTPVRLLSLYASVLAPVWYARLRARSRCGTVPFKEMPLVTIDNLPSLSDEEIEGFSDTLRLWVREGARILLACTPATRPLQELLPEAFVFEASALEVAPSEFAAWARRLHVPDGHNLERITGRVPFLVDACRAVPEGNPAFDPGFLRSADRVMEHCLNEFMSSAAQSARWAMVMLGEGRLEDLDMVRAAVREDELAIVASSYPLFGIDVERGGFACIPLPLERDARSVACAVGGNEALSERCVRLLIARGRLERAGKIAAFLSEGARLRLCGRFPDACADAANDGSIARSVRAITVGGGVDQPLRAGLSRLARIYAIAHDVPVRLLPDAVQRYAAGTSTGALRALRVVLGYWKGLGGALATLGTEDAALLVEEQPTAVSSDDILERMVSARAEESAAADAVACEEVYDIDTVVLSLGNAGLQGDQAAYREQLRRLCCLVPFARGGLDGAIYATHAAICGFLCDCPEIVLSWIEPMAARLVQNRENPERVGGVSDALLEAMEACARLLVEKPSAPAVSFECLRRIRGACAFFEEREIEPGIAVMGAVEAACMIMGGLEKRAEPLLRSCQARWSAQGTLAGQLFAAYGLCVVRLAQDAVHQAAVHAQMAEALAQRLGMRRGVWVARLLETVSAVRVGSGPELDRRLLEATLRQTSLHPAVSVALNLELALLYAASGDGEHARDILQSVQLFGRPSAYRLLAIAVRGLGRDRACVLDAMPRALRHEYESLRLVDATDAMAGCVQELPAGLLSLPNPNKGLSINLFGSFRVAVHGHGIVDADWGRRKARLLLVLLALTPDVPVARDDLIEAIWGAHPTPLARNNLNTALTSLRATLGQKGGGCEYVVSAGGTLGLNPMLVDTDVQRFECLARRTLSRCSNEERGGILDACGVIEHLYQDGVAPELGTLPKLVHGRLQELAGLYVDCMLLGSRLALEDGDVQLALWFARAANRSQAEREDVHQALERAVQSLTQRHGDLQASGDILEPIGAPLLVLREREGSASVEPKTARIAKEAALDPVPAC